MDMTWMIAGMVLFFGAHLVRVVAPGFRDAGRARLGVGGWKALYSLISLAGFVLLVMGYASARWGSPLLWGPPAPWMRMLVALAMLPALILFISTYLPGRIRLAVRHPMVIATAVWAALHLLVNGRVADLVLFGSFLVWALLLAAHSFRRPWFPPSRPPSLWADGVAIAAGATVWWWLSFGGGHLWLFRMPVM
jgi:uncharacterized membrane protein